MWQEFFIIKGNLYSQDHAIAAGMKPGSPRMEIRHSPHVIPFRRVLTIAHVRLRQGAYLAPKVCEEHLLGEPAVGACCE